jgi:hypothetical protein
MLTKKVWEHEKVQLYPDNISLNLGDKDLGTVSWRTDIEEHFHCDWLMDGTLPVFTKLERVGTSTIGWLNDTGTYWADIPKKQCCGPGSVIQYFFDLWSGSGIKYGKKIQIQDKHLRSYIRELSGHFLGYKYAILFQFSVTDQDQGWKNPDPG